MAKFHRPRKGEGIVKRKGRKKGGGEREERETDCRPVQYSLFATILSLASISYDRHKCRRWIREENC